MMESDTVSKLPLPEAASSEAFAVQRRLGDFESVTGRLEAGSSAVQAFELEGRAGNHIRLRVKSEDFHAVAFVVLVAGRGQRFWKVVPGVAPGGPESNRGAIEAELPLTLPTDGVYRVVITSLENEAQRRAVSSGEYRMILLVDAPSIEPPVESERGTRFAAWESDSR